MANLRVMLIYGGQSSEHDISVASARNVFAALDDTKYDISTCLIDREGRWWLLDTIDDFHSGSPQLLPVLGQKRFITLPDHKIVQPDVLLPILHGKNGEDGTVQGLAKLLGIPCAGPSLLSAALTMDKDATKQVLKQSNIPVVDSISWKTDEKPPLYTEAEELLGSTVFVKPCRSGSSLGVSRVTDNKTYAEALKIAAEHDSIVLIEKAIFGRELQIAVLGNHQVQLTDICEIIQGADFHNFDDKYNPGSKARFNIPAQIPEEITEKLKDYARTAYNATRCKGLARIDFFLSNEDELYLNEINAIPGFTSVSVYPRLWRHKGVSYSELVDHLIALALE